MRPGTSTAQASRSTTTETKYSPLCVTCPVLHTATRALAHQSVGAGPATPLVIPPASSRPACHRLPPAVARPARSAARPARRRSPPAAPARPARHRPPTASAARPARHRARCWRPAPATSASHQPPTCPVPGTVTRNVRPSPTPRVQAQRRSSAWRPAPALSLLLPLADAHTSQDAPGAGFTHFAATAPGNQPLARCTGEPSRFRVSPASA